MLLKVFSSNSSNRIGVVSSRKSRTLASLQAFVQGLPSTLTSSIDYEPSNPNLLSFHENINYQTYCKKDKQLKAKLQAIQMQPYSKRMARNILERLYTPSFIDKLSNGHYSIIDHDSGKFIKNEVDAARMLYSLYSIGSNLREEGMGDLLRKYFLQNESAWFAYLHDAKVGQFSREKEMIFIESIFRIIMKKVHPLPIERSPTISLKSYSMIFILHTEKCSQTQCHALSFAHDLDHAETIIPFLSSTTNSDSSAINRHHFNETYTYENNGWRGELGSPMAANVQWEIYRHMNLRQESLLIDINRF